MAVSLVGYDVDGNALDYMTMAAWFAVAVNKDEGRFWYSDANKQRYWSEAVDAGAVTTKCLSITGMLPNRGVVFSVQGTGWYKMSGDLSALDAQVIISNVALRAGAIATGNYGIQWNDTSALGEGVRITNCDIRGFYRGIYFQAGKSGVCQADKCFVGNGASNAVHVIVPGSKLYNCTIIGGNYGVAINVAAGAAAVLTNCYVSGGTILDIFSFGAVDPVVTYCSSSDNSALTWGGVGNFAPTHVDDLRAWGDNSNGFTVCDYRIIGVAPGVPLVSPLYHKGTNLGLLTDCDGNPVDPLTPSVGWHEGTDRVWDAGPLPSPHYEVMGSPLAAT